MSIALVRVDDRLIHGQVVVGWGRPLAPDRIVVIDDAIADSEWERDLYRVGVPAPMEVDFWGVADAASRIAQWQGEEETIIVLLGDVATLFQLCDAAPQIHAVNLGGLHEGGDRQRRLPYLYLSDDDVRMLRELAERGVEITAQDLPTTSPVPLDEVG